MDIVVKITLVAAIILMGYNISDFISNYKTVCDKIQEFKDMAAESKAEISDLRRSSFLMSFALSAGFVALTYFSGLAMWISAVVALKFVVTMYSSDVLLVNAMRSEEVSRKCYLVGKIDSLLNAFMGLAVAFVLIL